MRTEHSAASGIIPRPRKPRLRGPKKGNQKIQERGSNIRHHTLGGQRRRIFCEKRKNRFVPRGTGPKKGVRSSRAISKIPFVPREIGRRRRRRPISLGTARIFEMAFEDVTPYLGPVPRGTKRFLHFFQKCDAFVPKDIVASGIIADSRSRQ